MVGVEKSNYACPDCGLKHSSSFGSSFEFPHIVFDQMNFDFTYFSFSFFVMMFLEKFIVRNFELLNKLHYNYKIDNQQLHLLNSNLSF